MGKGHEILPINNGGNPGSSTDAKKKYMEKDTIVEADCGDVGSEGAKDAT